MVSNWTFVSIADNYLYQQKSYTKRFFVGCTKVDGRKNARKIAWTSEENAAIMSFFKSNIQGKVVPGKDMVDAALAKFAVLKRRKWRIIKAKVANIIGKM